MAFPTSPTNGQQANINGITYTYSSAATAWTVSTSVSNTFVSINVSNNVNSGNVLATGVISATGNITGGNLSGTSIVGTLTTAAQTNITSVGTLGSLIVTANTTSGNVLTGGLISATGNISANNATFTSNQTLSYGTANGVAYLDGSKVLTTGSALVFDGSNLGIGTSSPSSILHISKGATSGAQLNITRSSATATVGVDNGNSIIVGAAAGDLSIRSSNANILFADSSGTESMRLASGNLGIGTTSPSSKLHVKSTVNDSTNGLTLEYNAGTAYYGRIFSSGNDLTISADTGNTGGTMRLLTGGTERARIDSIGSLLVNATSIPASYAGARLYVAQTTVADYIAAFDAKFATAGSNYGINVKYTAASPNGTGNEFFAGRDSTNTRFLVYSNGGIANYSANNVNLSDRREKTNFAPAGDYLAKICAIPVQTFNYIDQNLEEDDGLTLGVVAQDVQAVAPEMVMESNWGTEEEPKMRLSIYQTDLQYALMKCIQEQQALITQLTARITALENA